MKIEFFGTSHGIPSDVRYCTSILVTVGENRYLFDAGAPAIDLLLRRGVPVDTLKAVFISHMHGDHVNGLPHLIDEANWAFPQMAFATYLPEHSGATLLRTYVSTVSHTLIDEKRLPLPVLYPGFVFDDGLLRVTAISVEHCKGFATYAFLLEAEGKRVYYTGDMSADLHDFPVPDNDAPDLVITEMAHCTVPALLACLQRSGATRVLLNHVYPVEKIDEMLANAPAFAGEMAAASDGMTVSL